MHTKLRDSYRNCDGCMWSILRKSKHELRLRANEHFDRNCHNSIGSSVCHLDRNSRLDWRWHRASCRAILSPENMIQVLTASVQCIPNVSLGLVWIVQRLAGQSYHQRIWFRYWLKVYSVSRALVWGLYRRPHFKMTSPRPLECHLQCPAFCQMIVRHPFEYP